MAFGMLILQAASAHAWGITGHRVVAEIAERNIKSSTRKKINKLIGHQKLAYWANWPDFIKSDEQWKYAGSFHYVNIPAQVTASNFLNQLEQTPNDQMYKKLEFFIHELKHNKQLSLETKRHYLYFIIHMVGDAHQPLHVGREEDLGGNKIEVEWFRKKTNLHSLWDSKLIDYEQYSYTEYADVLERRAQLHKKQWSSGTWADWLYDSYTQANVIYNSTASGDSLSYRYHYDHKELLEDQLTKGGLRLAVVLNDLFK